jgi:predicted metal-binding protein
MLKPTPDGPAIIVCDSCRPDGRAGGGARLMDALRAAKAGDPRFAAIDVQGMSCLFACAEPAAVHLRAPGKIGYVLGRFAPDGDAAAAILEYALHYARSAEGEVPYKLWPEGVMGHFLVRIPPPGHIIG